MEVSRKTFSNFILIGALLTGGYAAGQVTATPTPTSSTNAMTMPAAPTGISGYVAPTQGTGSVPSTLATIFGGYAGATGECASPDGVNTCNSCSGATGLVPCNQNSIYSTLSVNFTLQVNNAALLTGASGYTVRYRLSSNTATAFTPDTVPTTITPGVPFVVGIKWSNLCTNLSLGSDCASPTGGTGIGDASGVTLSVGIDSNNDGTLDDKVDFNLNVRAINPTVATTLVNYTPCPGTTQPTSGQGICDYTVGPGDEKVYIDDFAASNNDLSTTDNSSVKYASIVLFYGSTLASLTSNSQNVTLNLINNTTTEPSLSDRRIMGLQNDTQYCFALGNQDQAGNITFFPPTSEMNDADSTKVAKYCATPSQVVGLLDDKHCFIATATYGSMMAPEVLTFRKFRDRFLLTNVPGKAFVKAYYNFGPVAANWIYQNPTLKTMSLGLLWPLLIFAKLSLAIGMIPALLILLIGGVMLSKLWSQWRRTRAET